ncbi:hypothetical protein DDV21_010890 [Streptococcus chenjunshii]|uniref:LXG domain-containing protein n=1 Tax=Streptococcus chenjunshii TaxID=2173853 RepID=A0A372KL00_9STRE|nr:hypothetical protein [Streptococcus chenjunshii]AXQ79530.1 hypothetical protein DDV21_010890 [Streptococcus chenjunshii]RFU50106.1 hypothetical protein DDV22_10395 [Streptococcus chenjunshii]RFU52258.1 hypothetical protein DDV23_10620 [Streptococcus chenjunshii]
MGIKMSLGSSETQASTVSAAMSNRTSAYEGLVSALETFIGASDLQGQAYSSAKNYASAVLIPLVEGAKLLSQALADEVLSFLLTAGA